MEQLVIIKTWDKMAAEYGIAPWNSINVPFSFSEKMESYLPPHRIVLISEDKDRGEGSYQWLTSNEVSYTISKEMIEAYIPKGVTNG